MSKVVAALKYRLREQKNEVAAHPAVALLWLPRLALYSFAGFMTYRWLLSGSGTRLAAVFLALPLLTFAMCILVSHQRLFTAKEDSLLIAAPLTTRQFLLVKYAEVLATLLEVILVAVPVVVALGETRSWPAGILVFASLLLNMLLSGLLSVPAALLSVHAALAVRRRPLLLLLVGGALVCGTLTILLVIPESFVPGFSLVFPTWFWSHTGVVIAGQVVVICVSAVCSIRCSEAGYASARAQLVEAGRPVTVRHHRKKTAGGMLTHLRGGGYAILAKDTLVNLRSPMQWLRGFLMLALLSVYPVIRGWLGAGTPESTMVLNVSFAALLCFVLVGEVVTNAFSAELNRIRIILAAPVPRWRVVAAKLGAYCLPMLILCEASVIVLGLVSGLPLLHLVCSALVTAFVGVGMAGLLVGMGTMSAKPGSAAHGSMYDFVAEQAYFTDPRSFLVFVLGSTAVSLNLALVSLPLLLKEHGIALGAATLPLMLLLALEVNAVIVVLSVSFGSRCLGRLSR